MIFSDEINAGIAVDFRHMDIDDFIMSGRDIFADVIGADGKLTVTAVNQYGKLYGTGASVSENTFDCGAHRSSGKNNIVNENNSLISEVNWDVTLTRKDF